MDNKSEKWHAIHSETAQIDWKSLERFFAKGNLLRISLPLSLIDAALEISRDNKAQLEQWVEQGLVDCVSDEEALRWSTEENELWSVVVAPWVLVQEK